MRSVDQTKCIGAKPFKRNSSRRSFVCLSCCKIAEQPARHRYQVGVQDQAQSGWIDREVQGASCCKRIQAEVRHRLYANVLAGNEVCDLRMVIAITKYFDWTLDQLDVITAFLYGAMKEQVFCVIPEGVEMDGDFDCL